MTPEQEDYFLNPPPGSAAARAVELGLDLMLTLENLRSTPEDRIRKLDARLANTAELETSGKLVRRKRKSWEAVDRFKDELVIAELEAIAEFHAIGKQTKQKDDGN